MQLIERYLILLALLGRGDPEWALLLDLVEVLYTWVDVRILDEECLDLLPFSSLGLLCARGLRFGDNEEAENTLSSRTLKLFDTSTLYEWYRGLFELVKLHLKHFQSLSSEFKRLYCDDVTLIQDAWNQISQPSQSTPFSLHPTWASHMPHGHTSACSFIRYNELLIIMNYWLLFLLLFNPVMILFILFLSIISPLSLSTEVSLANPTWQDVFWLYQHSTMFHHQKWPLKKIRVLLQTKMDSPVVKAGCRDILRYMGSADLKRLLATVTNGQIRTETDDGKYGTCRVFAIRCVNARAWRNVWAIMRTFFFFLLLLTGPLGLKFRNNSFWRFVPPTYFSFMFVYESYFQTALSALTGKCHWVASGMHRTSSFVNGLKWWYHFPLRLKKVQPGMLHTGFSKSDIRALFVANLSTASIMHGCITARGGSSGLLDLNSAQIRHFSNRAVKQTRLN